MKKGKLLFILLVGMNSLVMGQMWTAQDALLKLKVAGICLCANMNDSAAECIKGIREGLMYTCAVKVHQLRDYSGLNQYDVTSYLSDFYYKIAKPKTGFCAQLNKIENDIQCDKSDLALKKICLLMEEFRQFRIDFNEEKWNSWYEWYIHFVEGVLRI